MNVIRIDQFQNPRTSFSQNEITDLLRQCRAMAGNRLGLALKAMLAKVDDALYELSEKDTEVQSNYFETMRDLRVKRAEIEQNFQQAFNAQFNDVVRSYGVENIGEETQTLELSLVDAEEMEETIAFVDMASKLEMLAGAELTALKQRIRHLLAIVDFEDSDNPISPAIICHAFQKACEKLDVSIRVRLVIYKLFDRYVISAVAAPLYHEINEFLVEKGVLPVLPKSSGNRGSDDEESDLFAEIQRRIVGDGTINSAPVAGAAQNFMQTLSGLQHGDAGLLQAYRVPSSGSALDAGAAISGLVNVIRTLQESGATAGMGSADAVTIDVVAMLFDYILDDKNLPDAMKALIGRLQIPVLKVALADRKFFNRRQHPTRQLLNSLSFAALGWDESLGHEDRLYQKVDAVVQRVLNEYDDDPDLFRELLEDFQGFLTQEEKEAARRAEVTARLAQSRDRVQSAREQVRKEVSERLQRPGIPAPVAQFLGTYWRAVLLLTYIREGEGSMGWKRSLTFMENLIWSVTPKPDTQEKDRLVKVLPNIIRILHDGMEQASMPVEERNHFLAQLAGYHAKVVNQESMIADSLQSRGAVHDYLRDPTAPAPVPPSLLLGEEVTSATLQRLVECGQLEAEEIVMAEDTDGQEDFGVSIVDLQSRFIEQVQGLEVGQWLELPGEEGQAIRAKLSWVSPITRRHLFVNRKGHKAADLSEESLIAAFQCGKARVIVEEPALDRAVSQVVSGLRAQAV